MCTDVSKVLWPLGQYKSQPMEVIPNSYLTWAIERAPDMWPKTKKLASDELERRKILGIEVSDDDYPGAEEYIPMEPQITYKMDELNEIHKLAMGEVRTVMIEAVKNINDAYLRFFEEKCKLFGITFKKSDEI